MSNAQAITAGCMLVRSNLALTRIRMLASVAPALPWKSLHRRPFPVHHVNGPNLTGNSWSPCLLSDRSRLRGPGATLGSCALFLSRAQHLHAKPDVCSLHPDLPESIQANLQEARLSPLTLSTSAPCGNFHVTKHALQQAGRCVCVHQPRALQL